MKNARIALELMKIARTLLAEKPHNPDSHPPRDDLRDDYKMNRENKDDLKDTKGDPDLKGD